MIKLIASDMDGTLLNDKHDIDKETIEAIKRAEDKGIVFAISTGREYDSVKGVLEKHKIRCQCVLSNGAEYRDEDGNVIDYVNIDENIAKDIMYILDENKLSGRIFTNKGVYTTSTREEALKETAYRTKTFNPHLTIEEATEVAKNEQFFKTLKFVNSVEEFFNEGIEVRKFVAFNDDVELINRVKKSMKKINGLAVSSSFEDNIEITDEQAQKGIILEKVSKKMGLKNEEVMIIGDSFNDSSMFEIFEESVAMKNAIPEIKKMAKYITDYNYKLGVCKAIDAVLDNELHKMKVDNYNR